MTLNEFVNKYLGKKVDFDGYYGGQCVDLYRQYVKDVLGFPQSPGVGGAAEIWDSASPEYYDFIPNTPTGVPEPGDIVIWNRRMGGGFGHVAIFLNGDVNSFTSLDQNWPTLDKVTKTEHNYNSVIGWLHPKENMPDDGTINIPKKTFEDLVTKATKLDAIRTTIGTDSATEIKSDYDNYKRDLENKNKELANERLRADNARAELNELVKACAEALGTVQEPNQILTALDKLKDDLDRLDDLERQYAELQVASQKEKEELVVEVERLKAIVKNGTLDKYTTEELISEIIKRINKILRRSS